MGYGLYQGLNEAYDSFRGRQRDIESTADREADRLAREETARRATEEYEYGLSRRPDQERLNTLQLEEAERQGQRSAQETTEFLDPEAIESRRVQMTQQNELLANQLQSSGIKLDQAELDQKAATSRRKYQEWSERWNDGSMNVEQLVEAFNSDDIQGNNIAKDGIKEVGSGWEITMENGVVQKFADRRAVTRHLQESSSPEFLQTMLLNELKANADLAVAMNKADVDASVEMNKRGNAWIGNTDKEMKAYMGKVFPGGLASSFGADGEAELAANIRAMTNRIGRVYGYDVAKITPSEVAVQIGVIAKDVMETDPEARKQRSAEIIENMGDEKFADTTMFPDGRPDPGSSEYESLMSSLDMQQARADMQALEQATYSRFALVDVNGEIKGKAKPKTGTAEKSVVPVPPRPGETTATTSSEGGSTSSLPPPEPIVTVGTPEYRAQLEEKTAGLRAREEKMAALDQKLGRDKGGREFFRNVKQYTMGAEYKGMSADEQEAFVDAHDDGDGLTNVQARKLRKAIDRKRKGLAPRKR